MTSSAHAELGRVDERERRPRCVAKFAAAQLEGLNEIEIWGVRGRNSDNTRLKQVLRWESQVPLEKGSDAPTIGSRTGHRIGFRYSFVVATFPPLPGTKERLNPSAKTPPRRNLALVRQRDHLSHQELSCCPNQLW